MKWSEYECLLKKLTKSIYSKVENQSQPIVNSGYSNKWPGVSGYQHQIDVSIEGPSDIVIVECKCWEKAVDLKSFLVFVARIVDLRARESRKIHAIFATTKRFPRGGIQKLAEHFEITPAIVKSEEDFILKYKHLWEVGISDKYDCMKEQVEISKMPSN